MVFLTAAAKKEKIVWGWDDGYGDGKGVTGKGTGEALSDTDNAWERFVKTGELLIPYYVAPYRKPKKRDPNEKIDLLSHITVIMSDGSKWIVGQGAIDQDSNGAWDGQEDKHSTVKFPVYMKAFLGIMAMGEEVSVDILGMGLPVEYEEDETRHQKLEELIFPDKGWHKCTIILADQKTIWEPQVNIKQLIIKKQAESALYDQFLDADGEVADRDLPRKFNIVADIGARTFGVFGMNGLTPVDDLIFQTDDGMYVPYELIRQDLMALRGAHVNDIQIPSIIRSGTFLNAANEEVNIRETIVKTHYTSHASKCASILKTKAKNWLAQVHKIIWVGGGPEQLGEYIKSYMGEKVPMVFAGRFSNASGQRKIALRYLKAQEKGKIKAKIGNTESEAG